MCNLRFTEESTMQRGLCASAPGVSSRSLLLAAAEPMPAAPARADVKLEEKTIASTPPGSGEGHPSARW